MADLLALLAGVVGPTHVLTQGDLSAWEVDWRKRWRGRALAVVRPGCTAEVAEVVRLCAAHGQTIVPQGGNTGLVGASVPDASATQVVVNFARMNRVRTLDPTNLSMTVEAGCVLQAVQEAADAQNLLFPLSLAAEGSCTIGGNLATNAGGTQVLRYGNARELCLGLEVVTAAGEVWDGLSALRKDNTGYDLRDLFIGSEGTLGLITAAVLKLHPRPAGVVTALATCANLEAAVALLQHAQARACATLTGFEAMGDWALALVRRHYPALPQPLPPAAWSVLLELSDPHSEAQGRTQMEAVLADALAQGLIGDAAVAQSQAQSRALWQVRESIPLAQAQEGLNIKHDISVPVSRIPAFVATTDARLRARWPHVRLVNFGHLGDGNLHYNVQAPPDVPAAQFLQDHETDINQIVYAAVQEHAGSISAEHGIGALKRAELARSKSPVALSMMRAIKQALDPQNLLNPGRVL